MNATRASTNDPQVADFAALLKTLRSQAGLTQQMLADRALISVQAVSALECGYRKVPYRKTLERIVSALALSEEDRAALELSAQRARGSRIAEQEPPATTNLPRQLTSLLGRAEVVEELADMVREAPLATIVGAGGAGKTRVAVAVGEELLDSFPDGVWFVDLAPIGDPTFVTHAVAATLRIGESTSRSFLETLTSYLSRKRMLIIFDNCEHLISEVRLVIGSLLRACGSVALLATSREPLTIRGERVYRLPPLAVPPRGTRVPEEALRYAAVELFADRVGASDATFAIKRENVEPIVEICRRLDGLPLAIELAAARATVLAPEEICERLDRIFDVLTTNGQATLPRHQTMRAVIDWSYALLSSQGRLLFDRLAIFPRGFTLDVASEVCGDAMLPPEDILEILSHLIMQSLVTVDFERGKARYHLLEATRQYAMEKLTKRGERQALAHRHTLAFSRLAQRLDRSWYDALERLWYYEAEAELDSFRAALDWSLVERKDLSSGCLLAAALARVWYSLAPVEGRRWVRLALQATDEETSAGVRAQLYIADAELCGALGEYKSSLASAEQALRLRSALDELQVTRAKQTSGSALGAIGRADESEAVLQDALACARRLDNRRLQALVLGDLGTARSRHGDVEGARRFYAEALAYYAALGLERPAASIAGNLAEVEFACGDAAAALQRAQEALAGHEATQNRRSVANDLSNMAAYLTALNCFDDARTYAKQALNAVCDLKQTVLTAYVLQHASAVAALEASSNAAGASSGELERAAMLLGFVDARLSALEARREHTERQEYERILAALRGAFGARTDQVMALGAEWVEDSAIAVALDLTA